jgi:AsmA protein
MMKSLLRWVGIAVGLLLVTAIALPLLIDANSFRPQLEAEMSRALGRDVKVGDLKLSLFSGGVAASDLAVADDPAFAREPFLQAKAVRIGVELLPLIFSHKLNVTGVQIDEPRIALLQSPAGEWNFSTLGAKSAAKATAAPASSSSKLDLSVKLVKISNGRFSLGHTAGRAKPLVLEKVDAELRDFSAASEFPFSFSSHVVGGGKIKLDGAAGPLADADLSRTPARASLKISGFDLAGSGWTQAMPGMAGIVALDGNVKSDGKLASVEGKLTAEKLKLSERGSAAAKPVELDLAVTHDLHSRAGRISQSALRIGAAKAAIAGTYAEQGEQTVVRLTVAGPDLPVTDLAAMLPVLGLSLPNGATLQSGTASVKLEAAGPLNRLVTEGTIALNNTVVAGFDLGRKLAVLETLAGVKGGSNTEIQTLGAGFHMAPEGIAAQNLQLIVPAIGELAGAGKISPENALDFHMTAKLHTGGMLAAVADRAVPFTVQGTCADPVFRPDMKSVVTENAKGVGVKAAQGLLNRFLGGKK